MVWHKGRARVLRLIRRALIWDGWRKAEVVDMLKSPCPGGGYMVTPPQLC